MSGEAGVTTDQHTPGLTRRSLLGAAATAVVAGSTAAKLLQQMGPEALGGPDGLRLVVAQHQLRTDHVSLADLRRAQGADGVIAPFVLVGVSAGPGLPADREHHAWIRTRGADGWSEWQALVFAPEEGPDGAEAAASSPRLASQALWVGFSDAVEIELPTGLERGATVHLVRETPVVVAHHSDALPAFTSFAPRPSIRPRSDWNARPFDGTPSIASSLKMAIVHHTVTRNGYSAGEVPGMIASIQNFHMDGNGWSDIGYNFTVDRFGRIWEARQGGITRAVIGGHAFGHNTATTGMAVLGDHDKAQPSQAAVDALAALAAWKLGHHGVDVTTSTHYDSPSSGRSGTYRRIIGHRDVGATACPGGYLYPRLGDIRQQAFVRQGGFPDVPVDSFYAEAVAWLVINGITTGVGDTGLYKPDDDVNRAQMATFLWRMMGSPTGSPPHGFPDVPAGSYYDTAVSWARDTGVTDGVGNTGRYRPDDTVNRDQMATFLHRVAGLKAPSQRHPFPDVSAGAYYDRAVSWAFEHGITDGVGNTGLYKPDDPVTRAQMATFLWRVAGQSAAWASGADLPPAERF